MNVKTQTRRMKTPRLKETQTTGADERKTNMEAFSPYSARFLCNFGLSHVGHQTTKKLFFFFLSLSSNFVYSVIINQTHCMTAFWAQKHKEYVGRQRWKKQKRRKEEDVKGNVSEIATSKAEHGVCVSLESRVCTGLCLGETVQTRSVNDNFTPNMHSQLELLLGLYL